MNNINKISNPGEYVLTSLKLTSYNGFEVDLRSNMLELVIHEGVYQNFLCGELLIGENVDLKRHVPLTGNEVLEISFKTASFPESIRHKFYVYKASPGISLNTNNKATSYHLFFVSFGGINTQIQKLSRSYANLKYSEMVTSIFVDYSIDNDKSITVLPTSGKKQYIIPYMSPVEAINILSSRSVSEDLQSFSYVFYETLDEYKFIPINYDENVSGTYTQFPPNLTRSDGIFRELNSEMGRIHSLSIENHIDTVDNIGHGVYASRLVTHDCIYKAIEETDYTYSDYNDVKKINTYGILPPITKFDSPNMNRVVKAKHSFLYENVMDSDNYEDSILKRKAHFNHFKNNKISILVSGDSTKRAGQLVSVNILAGDTKLHLTDNPFDYYLSGKYLIAKVTHMIQVDKYVMRLDLERDSMPRAFPSQKE